MHFKLSQRIKGLPTFDEELSPEEERARELEIEIRHLKRKYGEKWMKYYPYHLDSQYDDENDTFFNGL